MVRNDSLIPALALAWGLLACGGTATGTAQDVVVDIQPRSAQVQPLGTVAFAGAVTGTADTAVLWEVVESVGGTIDATGHYTASSTLGQYHVRASSHADPAKSALATVTVTATGTASSLQVQGRNLLDTCGDPLVVRGVEQIFGVADTDGNGPFSLGGSYAALVDQIANTGANAIRILPQSDLPAADVDAIIGQAASHQMVVFISNNGLSTDANHVADPGWLARSDIIAAINKYPKWTVIDAMQEYGGSSRAQWRADAIARVQYVRGLGYTQPFVVIGPTNGRDLPSILAAGAAITAADPLGRTIIGWQAYWGNSGYYQGVYGMTLLQGVNQAAATAFPIQIGILNWAEVGCTDALAYKTVMSAAQANGQGWLWWDWVLPGYRCFDLSTNGHANSLTTDGNVVVNDPTGILATSRKACGQ
jgi:hypothetical protein